MSLIFLNSAELKSDIRLAQALSEFGAALDHRYRPSFKTWQTHSPPTENDVLTRVGDLLVGGSQNLIASGVWAAVRLSSQVATGYLFYSDKVSSLLMRLGKSLEIQRDRVLLFPTNIELKGYMCEYLIVIVNLCRRIVLFEGKSLLSQLASGLTLEKEFKDFETQLEVWSKLINEKIQYLTNKSQAEASTAIATINSHLAVWTAVWTECRKNEAEERRLQVLDRLSPHQDEFERIWRREHRKVYGSLGSGKTVAMANIVGDKRSSAAGNPDVASFFCQFSNEKTLQPHVLFPSLAHQFLRTLGVSASHPAIRKYLVDYEADDPESIVEYMQKYFPRERHYYVILDALDELDIQSAQIFALVAVAKRPLTKDELRVALNIEPGLPLWNSSTLSDNAVTMIYRCGGGLLQIDEEDNTVHFIHHSAQQHLMIDELPATLYADDEPNEMRGVDRVSASQFLAKSLHFDLFLFHQDQADVLLGFICVTCLNLELHDRQLTHRRRLVISNDALQTIKADAHRQSIAGCFITMVLERRSQSQPGSRKFDMAAVIQSLSKARETANSNDESQLFFGHASKYWLDHTSGPSFDPKDEMRLHRVRALASLIRGQWLETMSGFYTPC
ncbi:hypothetical protein NKR23_g10866 [Pleurostoma richardsiae]|uniref:Nephrocystin 3-like N-terminal domain-containing protein n=1 Tax=Pleurostoma richardsiae TaxID=41990 RepID=A0AA38R4H9_9PEZI|nr:hypothetical protein NKR23_g10866 [Pleurostoma richardsiae]